MAAGKRRTRRAFRVVLLSTVSAVALVALVEGDTVAQERISSWWLEFGGMYDFWDASDANQYFILPGNTVKPGDGFHISGEVGAYIGDTPWYATLGGKWGKSQDETASFYSGAFTTGGSVESSEEHAVVDFQVGRDVGLGILGLPEGALKANAGVRYTYFKGSESGIGTYSGFGTGPIGNTRKFSGLGPRIGIEGSVPLQDSKFAVDFSAGGAILFGKQKTSINSDVSFATYAFTRRDTKAVPNVDAFLGISFNDANFSVSAGYSVDAYFGMVDAGYFTNVDSDRIFHGPSVKLKVKFD
ncbi:Lpg1974 family pore-forming outer membrane protein [Nitratireductor sp. XY-223]|uniref:Lpg1974 family pore-forming outer membrane protein n=1 Tax=Nitratireductor sp. XY-223 TaxID=2561926 RepID=UPI0010AA541B|nr:Lpg1974 family pore-forming outer membrane protein [Nitratireductor sp. XY-223]